MNKSDLNSSMLFKIKNYGLCVLLERKRDNNLIFCDKNRIKNGNSGGISSLNDYDDNLMFNLGFNSKEFDITAIKQYDSCTQVINMVLNDEEPKEWDWIEEVKENNQNNSPEEANTPIVNNITINITVDSSNNDPEQIIKQINNAIKRNGICC